MDRDTIIMLILMLLLLIPRVLRANRKAKRYGGHTDQIRIRASFISTRGFSRRHPGDHLYGDDGKINRNWKP